MHLLGRHSKGIGKLRARLFSRYPTERLGVRPNSEKIILPQELGWPHGEVLGGLEYDLELPVDAKISVDHAGEDHFNVILAYRVPHKPPAIRLATTVSLGLVDQKVVETFEFAKADIARKHKRVQEAEERSAQ
jgi:hypothetical protein